MTKQTESERFRAALKQIVSVPKAEIDRREAEWRKARKAKKEAKAA
jgi:hypothetical protein